MEKDRVVIIGCGGHARSVADIVLDNNPDTEIVFVDDNAHEGEIVLGFSPVKEMPADYDKCFVAIGDNLVRKKLSQNKNLLSVISKHAYLGKFSELSEGVFVGDSAHIGPLARVGKGTIINTHAVIEHEVQVGEFSHISVNAAVCGRSKVGNNVFLGAGATVKDGVNICDDVIIGAGSVVIDDIVESGTYVGCPARKIKKLERGV